jgi:hypothetical protein
MLSLREYIGLKTLRIIHLRLQNRPQLELKESLCAFFKKTVFREPPSLLGDFRGLFEKSPVLVTFPVNNLIHFFFLMPYLLP